MTLNHLKHLWAAAGHGHSLRGSPVYKLHGTYSDPDTNNTASNIRPDAPNTGTKERTSIPNTSGQVATKRG